MRKRWPAILLSVLATLSTGSAAAQSTLRVSPVLLEVRAPGAATSLQFWNESDRPVNVQVRLFRWAQTGGEDVMEPTEAVAVSPPLTTLAPGSENVIRVVRTTREPVLREESYRVLVDELPDPGRQRPGTVALVLRHSIPVFFAPPRAAEARVDWTVEPAAGGLMVTARNSGGSRLRVADLVLSADGRPVAQQAGLVGYVLAGSSASWLIPAEAAAPAGPLEVAATSEAGQIRAVASREVG